MSTPPDSRSATPHTPVSHPVPQQHGVLVLRKPRGPTSAACIARIKRGLGQKKIGHAGTLDPMAEGVLLVLLGEGTKISGPLMDEGEKIYSGVIRLGVVTDTWDTTGNILRESLVSGIVDADVRREIAAFVGSFDQEVPPYSAAKHEGKPLYALARKGVETPVKVKTVTISRGEAELVGPDRVRFRITCSSGTYIRSLAHSLGNRLGCGASLEELLREYSHPFGLDEAHSLEDVLSQPGEFAARVKSIAESLPRWPKLRLTGEEAARVMNGHRLAYEPERMAMMPCIPGIRALFLDGGGDPLALAETSLDKGGESWSLLRGLWNRNP